jgi:hypothetical protein
MQADTAESVGVLIPTIRVLDSGGVPRPYANITPRNAEHGYVAGTGRSLAHRLPRSLCKEAALLASL